MKIMSTGSDIKRLREVLDDIEKPKTTLRGLIDRALEIRLAEIDIEQMRLQLKGEILKEIGKDLAETLTEDGIEPDKSPVLK